MKEYVNQRIIINKYNHKGLTTKFLGSIQTKMYMRTR